MQSGHALHLEDGEGQLQDGHLLVSCIQVKSRILTSFMVEDGAPHMPDDLGMGIGKTLEGERELVALRPEVVEVRAVDAREEVAGPPCCRNDDHGVGVADIELVLDPPRDVEEGGGMRA